MKQIFIFFCLTYTVLFAQREIINNTLLKKNKFITVDTKDKQIFDAYIGSEYPLFITADSLLFTLNVLFDYSIQEMEITKKSVLKETLLLLEKELSANNMHEDLRKIMLVALKILDADLIDEKIQTEYNRILQADTSDISVIRTKNVVINYRQFRPNKFYQKEKKLTQYFTAIKWLKRCINKNEQQIIKRLLKKLKMPEDFFTMFCNSKTRNLKNFNLIEKNPLVDRENYSANASLKSVDELLNNVYKKPKTEISSLYLECLRTLKKDSNIRNITSWQEKTDNSILFFWALPHFTPFEKPNARPVLAKEQLYKVAYSGFIEPAPNFYSQIYELAKLLKEKTLFYDTFLTKKERKTREMSEKMWKYAGHGQTNLSNLWDKFLKILDTSKEIVNKKINGEALSNKNKKFIEVYGRKISEIMLYPPQSYFFSENNLKNIKIGEQELIPTIKHIYILFPYGGKEILCRGSIWNLPAN